jgi:hypothetical protein
MTANQFGDHLALFCGQPTLETSTEPEEAQSPDANTATPDTSPPDPPISFLKEMTTNIEKDWPLPMRGLPTLQVMDEYRRKLVSVIFDCRIFEFDSIILSGEGMAFCW